MIQLQLGVIKWILGTLRTCITSKLSAFQRLDAIKWLCV